MSGMPRGRVLNAARPVSLADEARPNRVGVLGYAVRTDLVSSEDVGPTDLRRTPERIDDIGSEFVAHFASPGSSPRRS
jgi:hypothetical protein